MQAVGGAAGGWRHVEWPVGELGIAEAEAERIDRLALEVAVGTAFHAVIAERRQVGHAAVESQRQAPARIGLAAEHVGNGEAAGLARIPRFENRRGVLLAPRQVDRAAVHGHHDQRLAGGLGLLEHGDLVGRQVQRGLVAAGEAGHGDAGFLGLEVGGEADHGHQHVGLRRGAIEIGFRRSGDALPRQVDATSRIDGDGITVAALQRHRLHRRQVIPARLGAIDEGRAVERHGAERAGQAEPVGAAFRGHQEAGPHGAVMVVDLGQVEIALAHVGLDAADNRLGLVADGGKLLGHVGGVELGRRRRHRVVVARQQPGLAIGRLQRRGGHAVTVGDRRPERHQGHLASGQHLLQPVQHRDRRAAERRRIVAAQHAGGVAQRTDHGHLHAGLERQHAAVLQQH